MKKSYTSKLFSESLLILLFLIAPFFINAQNYCDTITLEANIPDTVFLCSSDSIQINADTGFVSYQWSRGDTTATVDLNYSGMYWLTVTDDSSCVEVDSVLVSLINSGLNQSDTTICYGDSISLTSWHQSENISSVYFDGDSSSISFSDAGFPTANSERSFEAWVYNAGQSGKNCLFSYGDQITGNVFSVFLDQYDSLSVQLNSDEYLCTQLIPQNSWTHIMVGTDPSNKYTFYVNGIFANSNFITGTYNTQLSGTAWIGRSSDTLNPAWFDGRIDEVRIWDRIISGGEVVDNMSFHTNTNSDNHLLRFFDFNHFTGNFSNDIYGYPAQLNLATTSNSIPFSAYTFRFLWSNGSTNPQTNITYFDSEITNLEISDDVNSCNHDLNVTVVPLPNLSDSIFLCNENQYELSTNFNYGSYQWNTGNNTSSIFVTNTGDYSLTVSDAACTYIDSVFISMISVEILNSDTAICDGESITLEAISSTATYHWSDDTQNPSITISPVSSAIYYVSASDGYNTCSDQVSVTVFPVYDPGLDDTLLLCNESYGLLNANNTYFDSFQWSNGDTTNFSVVTQTGTYQLTASDINGCTAIDQSYVQLMFTDIIENDTLLCNGLSFDLNVVSSGSNFVWSTGETTSVITVSNSGQYSVTQTSGTFTCPDTVNIYFSPEIILSLPDTLSSCEAEIFTLNAGSLPYDYEWNTGAIIPEIQVQTSGLYSVTATNQDGCEASDTTLVSIIDVVMSISDTLVCEGSEVIVSTNSTQYTYQWSNGMTDALIFVYPEQPTNYFIFVSDAFNTCDYMIDVDVINVETGPIFGNDTVWSDSTELYYVNANPGSTYDWYISGGTYNTDTLANIEIHWGPGIQGFISIVETSAEGCIGEAVEMDIVIQHPISIEQIISSDDFIIVPNPMRQSTHITIPGPYKNGLIQLFDITGKLLFEDELSGEVFYNLSQPHLAKGIYWIRLTGEESISKKLMVE